MSNGVAPIYLNSPNEEVKLKAKFVWIIAVLISPFIFGLLLLLSVAARFTSKKIDVGLGPEPLINNVHHKRALMDAGYSAETFVSHTYFITSEFDLVLDSKRVPLFIRSLILFVRAMFRYRILYIYFNGGPLGWTPLWRSEALFLRLAKVRTVVMPYGGDVHDLRHAKNLKFKAAMIRDYPNFQRDRMKLIEQHVDYWCLRADFVIAGCDWVDYIWHWDLIWPAHFSIDTSRVRYSPLSIEPRTLRLLHAPNHRSIKGTSEIQAAVDSLNRRGIPVELTILEKKSNEEVLAAIENSDVIVDQLVIGWHGIFALEAMAIGRPVICNLRRDLVELYQRECEIGTIPILNSTTESIERTIEELSSLSRAELLQLGIDSNEYVKRVHSTSKIGELFHKINREILV